MIKGLDTAQPLSAENARKLKELGYDFAVRYIVPHTYPKAINRDEMNNIFSAGMMVGFVWETTANRPKGGATAGLQDGKCAKELAESMGVSHDAVIYFAVDFHPTHDDMSKIAAYMVAAECAVRPYRMGIYGSYYVIEDMAANEIGRAYWQCVAWSNGKWSDHAHMQQREWNVKTGVVTVDNNYCKDADQAGLYGGNGMELRGYKRIKLYNNATRKTPAQIKKETGCDAILNGGVFSLSTFKPLCHLKINGVVLATDQYKYWGYGIENGKATLTQDESAPDYISCCCMVRNNEPEVMIYNPDMGGARQRTAIGTLPDGTAWGYATMTPTTPERLQDIAISLGVKDAIMLDGGASTWCISPKGELRGGRIAQNYVLFYLNDCPYAEPTNNIRWGSIGQGAKWVQWYLNQHGAKLSVDGIFGGKSVAALKAFQQQNGLVADGICGILTRAKLKS